MFDFMQREANDRLEVRLDNDDYDEANLVELKVPVNLPYQANWKSYQRYDGEIEINGIHYKYVKRKLANDTLYLKCIANKNEMRLQSARDEFFKITNDLEQTGHSKKPDNAKPVMKNLPTVYNGSSFCSAPSSPFTVNQQIWMKTIPEKIVSSPHTIPGQPPDVFAA